MEADRAAGGGGGASRAPRRLLLVAGLLATVLLAGHLLGGPILATLLERAIERGTGVVVEIGSVRGSLVGGVTIRGVRTVRAGAAGPLEAVEVDELRATWALPRLLRGVDAFVGGARIELDGARVSLDLAPAGGGGEPEAADTPAPFRPPQALPALGVRGLGLVVKRPGLAVRFGGISAETEGSDGSHGWRIAAGAESLAVDAPGVGLGPVPLALAARAGEAGVELDASIPGRGVQASLSYRGGAIDGRVALEALALGREGGVLRLPEGTVEGALSGEVRLLAGGGREPAVSCAVRLEGASIRGIPVERVTLGAALEGADLRVVELTAESGPNRVRVHDALVPLEALRAGDVPGALRAASGSFAAELGDLPALLALAGRQLQLPGAAPEHRLELAGSLGAGAVELDAGRLTIARGGARLEHLSAVLPPHGAPWSETALEAALAVELPDVALLNRLLPLPPLAGSLEGSVKLGGTLATLQGTVRVTARRLAAAGRAVGDLRLEAEATGGRFRVDSASLVQGEGANRVEVSGLELAAAALVDRRWQEALAGARGDFGAQITDVPALLALAGRPLPRAASVPAHRVEIAGRLDAGTIALSAAELRYAGGRAALTRARADIAGEGEPWAATVLDLAATVALDDIALPAGLLGLPGLGGSVRASATIGGTVAAPEGSLSARGERIAVAGVGGISFELIASGDRGLLRAERLEVRRGADFLTAAGGYSAARGRIENLVARFRVAQASAYGALLPEGWPALFGRAEGELAATGDLREPAGSFSLSAEDLSVGEAGPFRARAAGSFAGGALAVEGIALEAPQGELSAHGTLEREGERGARLRLTGLSIRRGAAAASLVHPAVLRYADPGTVTVDELKLGGSAGSLSVKGRTALEGDSDLSFEVAGLGTEGWLRGLAGGRVTVRGMGLRGSLRGSRANPVVRVAGEVAALGGGQVASPLSARIDLAYERGVLTVAAFELSGGGGVEASAAGRLPVDPFAGQPLLPGPLELSARLRVGDLRSLAFLLPASIAPRGSIDARLQVGGSWDDPRGEVVARLAEVGVAGIAVLEGREPLSAELEAEVGSGAVRLRSLTIASTELTAEASGTWTGAPSPGALLRGEGPVLQGTLDLRGSFALPDLAPLRSLAGNPRRLAGRAAGEFSVTGKADDPTVEATVRLDGGALDYGLRVPPLERVRIAATMAGRTLRIAEATGEAGGAPFRLGGELSWGEGAGLDLALAGENLLLYRDASVTARADLDLRASGPFARMRLEGEVRLRNSSYSRSVSLPELVGAGGRRRPPSAPGPVFSLRKPPWRDLRFDVRIGSGDPVALRTNLARGAVRPELTLTGTGALPVLSGNVFVDRTRVSLPAGTLVFERGIIAFPPSGAGEQRIDLAGRTRLLGYDVSAVVGGTVRSPEVTLSSIPPLPHDELLLLVLAGTPPGTADSSAMRRILEANLARFVAESVLGSLTGAGPGGGALAERVEVEVGRNVTRSGTATVETRFRVVGAAAGPGRALYLTGGTDVYDAYTMGVTVVFRFR